MTEYPAVKLPGLRACLRSLLLTRWLLGLFSPLLGQVPPTITGQPDPFVEVDFGGNLQLSVTAAGDPPFKYQWWHEGKLIPGATASTLIQGGVNIQANGQYWVVVVNDFGSAASSNAVVVVSTAPVISRQPVSQSVDPTQNIGFSVQASGFDSREFGYQWFKDGKPLAGAQGSNLSINASSDISVGFVRGWDRG